jgi:hypothetical protein
MRLLGYNLAFTLIYFFTILYNTLIYNEFDSISQYPLMFLNYILVLLSFMTFYLYEKKILTVIKFRRIYYITIGYNILVYFYLNLAIWTVPTYLYTFNTSNRKELFKDPSYLTYLIVLTLLSISMVSILKREKYRYKETIRYINMI